MGMPSISIAFTEVAATLVKRGQRGIIAMILRETSSSIPTNNPVTYYAATDVPKTISAENQEQIKFAMRGYQNPPSKVLAYFIASDAEDYSAALNALKTEKFQYLVCPSVETDELVDDVVSYVKTERQNKKRIKAILPNATGADSEGIINYTTASVEVGDKTYTAEKYCARIAGIIAGTPLTMSATYAPVGEATDCTRLTASDRDTAVDNGKLILWWDGEKVKAGRAVNSLTTTSDTKNEQFQKIKIVDAMDMIADDITKTIEDSYIGKYANTYNNKCLLLGAIGNYFDKLKMDGVLSSFSVYIDTAANKSWLVGKKGENGTISIDGEEVKVKDLTDDQINRANTGSNVFFKATLSMLDAMEDVVLDINI